MQVMLNNVWSAENDETKRHLNHDFKSLLWETLELEGSFSYPFDSLLMGKITSPDESFRIYNWNIELSSETYEYYCLIQKVDKKGNTERIIELIDYHDYITKIEQKELEPYEWFGALYYEIIPFEKNGNQYYGLIGLDINDRWSKIKVFEILQFKDESVVLGASVLKMQKGVNRRFLLECKADNMLTMNYEKKEAMVVFNHLTPMDPRLEDQFDFYINDLSFDALQWDKKKEMWIYIEDVDAKNSNSDSHLPDWQDPNE